MGALSLSGLSPNQTLVLSGEVLADFLVLESVFVHITSPGHRDHIVVHFVPEVGNLRADHTVIASAVLLVENVPNKLEHRTICTVMASFTTEETAGSLV